MSLSDEQPMSPDFYEHLRGFLTEERLQRFEEVLRMRTRCISVVLEDIFHSPNAGAVIRSADCLGIQDIHVIADKKPFQVNTDVVRGSAKWVTMSRYSDSVSCIEKLKSAGYAIAATTLRSDNVLYTPEELPLDRKIALCMGSEEVGLSDYILDAADYHVHIPMYGFTESFNVSVGAALCLRPMVDALRRGSGEWGLSDEEKEELRHQWVRASVRHLDAIETRYFNDLKNHSRMA